MRKILVATAAAVGLLAVNIVPAMAASGVTGVTLVNAAVAGSLSITTVPAPVATVATATTHTFNLGSTVVADTRGTETSVAVQLSVGSISSTLGGSVGSMAVHGCYNPSTDTVLPVGASAAADAASDCSLGTPTYKALTGTPQTVATITNDTLSKMSTVTYNPGIKVTDVNTADAGIFTFDITQTVV